MASATNLKEAGWLEDNGADAIIAQGIEAGGHRGKLAQSTHTRLSFRLLHPRLQFCEKMRKLWAKEIFRHSGVDKMQTAAGEFPWLN